MQIKNFTQFVAENKVTDVRQIISALKPELQDIKHNEILQRSIIESIYLIVLDGKDGLWDSLDLRKAQASGRRLGKKPKQFNGKFVVKIGRNTSSQHLWARNQSYRQLTTLPDSWEPVFNEKLISHEVYNFTGYGTDFIKQVEKDLKRWMDQKYKSKRYSTSEYYQFETMREVADFRAHLHAFFTT